MVVTFAAVVVVDFVPLSFVAIVAVVEAVTVEQIVAVAALTWVPAVVIRIPLLLEVVVAIVVAAAAAAAAAVVVGSDWDCSGAYHPYLHRP